MCIGREEEKVYPFIYERVVKGKIIKTVKQQLSTLKLNYALSFYFSGQKLFLKTQDRRVLNFTSKVISLLEFL